MRKPAFWGVLVLCLAFALPVLAQGVYEDQGGDEDQGALAAYGSSVGNRFLMGVNGLLTCPADPALGTVQPREEFDALPVAVVSKRVVGLLQGTLLGAFRAGMGVFDMLLAPVTPMRMVSPQPRYMVFPGVEHDWY